jgi:hypothetical protein
VSILILVFLQMGVFAVSVGLLVGEVEASIFGTAAFFFLPSDEASSPSLLSVLFES